ncbi:MAG: hypothetical protein RMJ04_13025 [Geminicoccaceae bacterium]|nr:hypothetical protein [Geminicoccaceae bacterium]
MRVEHGDGRMVESRFDGLVDSSSPFRHVRAVAHEVMPRLRLRRLVEVETFEMEEHSKRTGASSEI